MALMPLNLFVTHNGRSSRQHVTCRYKCGDACSKPVPNTSDNEYFGDIAKALSRRSVLQAGGIAVLAVGAGSALAACGRDAQPAATPTSSAAPAEAPPGMKFTAITPNSEDAVVIPEGYKQAVVISWGDPVLPNAPRFDVKAQTGAAQRGQFGFNNDYAGLLPIEGQPNHITDNHAGTDFAWDLLLVCGDPAAADTYFAGFDKTKVSPISCPDNVAFDSHGNLWIATDGNALGSNDGLFAVALEGPNRGETKQFLTVPLGAETCGPVVTGDLVTVCVQHPGENDENSIDDPLSRWPEGGNGTARPSVVAVWKANGQIGV